MGKEHETRRRNVINEYYQNPNICQYCGKVIEIIGDMKVSAVRKKKFCNHSCAAKFNNPLRTITEKLEACLNCGTKLNNRQTKYCSNACQQEYLYKEYIQRWKQGLEDGVTCQYSTSAHIIRYLKNKYNNQCARCGWKEVNPYTGKIPLEIEHIDGNYRNNEESNLIIICPNCHSLTSTYRSLNKGNGRAARRKYDLPT